jgi:alkyl sulfatase BDS1-like metallo-beta-lactamase superfamily hydrolase
MAAGMFPGHVPTIGFMLQSLSTAPAGYKALTITVRRNRTTHPHLGAKTMKTKIFAAISIVLNIILFAFILSSVFTLKKTRPVMRAPDSPEAADFQYTPPHRPKIAVPPAKRLANTIKMTKKKIEHPAHGVYLANNYGFGNTVMIETATGVVIVDTTENAKSARDILAEFRKITDKPIKKIIYTHGHVDHIFGTPVFMEEGTQVISTLKTVEFLNMSQGWLAPHLNRSRKIQAGRIDAAYAMKMPIDIAFKGYDGETLIRPTVTFDDTYTFKQDDTVFELYDTGGEASGHLIIWMPKEKICISGDLFYGSFPNLSTPMLSPRSAEDWISGIDRIISLGPEYLVPCHGLSLTGKTEILTQLTNYRNAAQYVLDKSIEAINQGKTVEAAIKDIRLPEKYASLPYLQEYYGRVDWSIRGIYRKYTGWYDGRGTGLNPLPAGYLAGEIVTLSGGVNAILDRAVAAQENNEHQLAVELADIVIAANPDEKVARIIKSYSLDYLGYLNGNLNMFGFYRSAAAMERKKADYKP